MRTILAIFALVAIVAVMALVIAAHEMARPFMEFRRSRAAADAEGAD